VAAAAAVIASVVKIIVRSQEEFVVRVVEL